MFEESSETSAVFKLLIVESNAEDTAVNSESLAYVLSNEDENDSTAVTLAAIALSVDCNEELSVVNPVVFVIVIWADEVTTASVFNLDFTPVVKVVEVVSNWISPVLVIIPLLADTTSIVLLSWK